MSQFTASPTQSENFPLWEGFQHNHPTFGFRILRNGPIRIDVGSKIDPNLCTFDVRTLPTGGWIALRDSHGALLPVELLVQPFGEVYGRFLGQDGRPVPYDPMR
jgi:hypothetical protein